MSQRPLSMLILLACMSTPPSLAIAIRGNVSAPALTAAIPQAGQMRTSGASPDLGPSQLVPQTEIVFRIGGLELA